MSQQLLNRLAVCSWSLQPETPADLFAHLETIGIRRVQIALDPIRDNPAVWGTFAEEAEKRGVALVSGMFGTIGEDYTTMETIKRTGGVVPDETWEKNWENIQATAALAQRMELPLVTFHAGFLPHDPADPAYAKLLGRLRQVADVFAARGVDLGFETGQEDAPDLEKFLEVLDRPNVGVNFDPANILLYDRGEPIEALRTLGKRLKQAHIKDAIRTKTPGEWGQEVPAGEGEVDWRAFFTTMAELGFAGDFCIEREAGTTRAEDIRKGAKFVGDLDVTA